MPTRTTFPLFFSGLLLLIGGCASNVPRDIKEAPPDNPTLNEVRQDIDQYKGSKVRWGGTIASVENKENQTWIEVVAMDLDSYGQPRHDDSSYGRFLVRIDQFIDPQIYAEGRELTIAGTVESRIVRPIGDHPYTFPLIRASTYYLWPEYRDRYYADHPRYRFGYYYGYPYHGYSLYYGSRFGHPYYPYWWW